MGMEQHTHGQGTTGAPQCPLLPRARVTAVLGMGSSCSITVQEPGTRRGEGLWSQRVLALGSQKRRVCWEDDPGMLSLERAEEEGQRGAPCHRPLLLSHVPVLALQQGAVFNPAKLSCSEDENSGAGPWRRHFSVSLLALRPLRFVPELFLAVKAFFFALPLAPSSLPAKVAF